PGAAAQAATVRDASQMPVAAAAVSPRYDFSNRYVQLKLWVEAGQLPSPAHIDVDAIVRDAVPEYAAAALRQIRAQQTAADAAAGSDVAGVAASAGATASAGAADAAV